MMYSSSRRVRSLITAVIIQVNSYCLLALKSSRALQSQKAVTAYFSITFFWLCRALLVHGWSCSCCSVGMSRIYNDVQMDCRLLPSGENLCYALDWMVLLNVKVCLSRRNLFFAHCCERGLNCSWMNKTDNDVHSDRRAVYRKTGINFVI